MGFNKEFISLTTKHDDSPEVEVGKLEPGLYEIKVWCTDDEVGFVGYAELSDDPIYSYKSAFPMVDSAGYVIPALAQLFYPRIISREASLYIDCSGADSIWENGDYTFVIDIYRVK